jgi:hypothetical protein
MLQKLLIEIEKGGTMNPAILAVRLQTSPGLIAMMLEDLERRGLLSRMSTQCSSSAACGGCPTASACSPGGQSQVRVWQHTSYHPGHPENKR